MSSRTRTSRGARHVQAECGVSYSTALAWVKDHHEDIQDLVRDDEGRVNWKQYGAAAASLWRQRHPEEYDDEQ